MPEVTQLSSESQDLNPDLLASGLWGPHRQSLCSVYMWSSAPQLWAESRLCHLVVLTAVVGVPGGPAMDQAWCTRQLLPFNNCIVNRGLQPRRLRRREVFGFSESHGPHRPPPSLEVLREPGLNPHAQGSCPFYGPLPDSCEHLLALPATGALSSGF